MSVKYIYKTKEIIRLLISLTKCIKSMLKLSYLSLSHRIHNSLN